jgi:hypothetical protein
MKVNTMPMSRNERQQAVVLTRIPAAKMNECPGKKKTIRQTNKKTREAKRTISNKKKDIKKKLETARKPPSILATFDINPNGRNGPSSKRK